MNLIIALEDNIIKSQRENSLIYLHVQKYFVEKYFSWISLEVIPSERKLYGNGMLSLGTDRFHVEVNFSPFYPYRYDRIYIKDKSIKYNDNIHVYRDLSLCLYHPLIDKPLLGSIPLYKLIPRISEWCVCYKEWKKYGVWLGKEIKHI